MNKMMYLAAATICGTAIVADFILFRYLKKVENLSAQVRTKRMLLWRHVTGKCCGNCDFPVPCVNEQSKCFCGHPEKDAPKNYKNHKCPMWL